MLPYATYQNGNDPAKKRYVVLIPPALLPNHIVIREKIKIKKYLQVSFALLFDFAKFSPTSLRAPVPTIRFQNMSERRK